LMLWPILSCMLTLHSLCSSLVLQCYVSWYVSYALSW
jgi:hypothetical protein